jgi:hypothetical protein
VRRSSRLRCCICPHLHDHFRDAPGPRPGGDIGADLQLPGYVASPDGRSLRDGREFLVFMPCHGKGRARWVLGLAATCKRGPGRSTIA